MSHDVFISYSSKDKAIADAVRSALIARDIACWTAVEDILPGAQWEEAIIDAIADSQIMVLILSSQANLSNHVKREVHHACEVGVAIIPFRIEEVMPAKALAYYLSSVHWLDAITQPLERHLPNLVEKVLLLKGKRKVKTSTTDPVSAIELSEHDPDTVAGLSGLAPKESERVDSANQFIKVPVAEVGHVLFLDIVEFSRLSPEQQGRSFKELADMVSRTEEFREALNGRQLIRLSTGDGIALVFFNNPESPLKCAKQITRDASGPKELKLRMGIHTGPIYRENATGTGLSYAQRVMDVGDAGHILVSSYMRETLKQFGNWSQHLYDLGNVEIKHDVTIHLYNFHKGDVGNPGLPTRLRNRKPVHWLRRLFS